MQRHHHMGTQFPRLPADFQSAPTENATNGTARKVKIPEEYLTALRSIAMRIGESDLVPEPTTHSLILKAISNYIHRYQDTQSQSGSQDQRSPGPLDGTAGRRPN